MIIAFVAYLLSLFHPMSYFQEDYFDIMKNQIEILYYSILCTIK